MESKAVLSLEESFAKVEDPRLERTKQHKLLDIIILTICGAIYGAETWIEIEEFGKAKQEWFEQLLELPNGIPSHDTFGRVFTRINPEEFEQCFFNWISALSGMVSGVIAIDSKTLRQSHKKVIGNKLLQIVSIWAEENRPVLEQLVEKQKCSETITIPGLLHLLHTLGCIVTIHTMEEQKEIAKQIRKRDGNYPPAPIDMVQSNASLGTDLQEGSMHNGFPVQEVPLPFTITTRVQEHSIHMNEEQDSSKIPATPAGNSHIEAVPKGRLPQAGKPSPPTLWLAFALSGVVLLLGTLILYALVPSHSPGSSKHPRATMTNPYTRITPTTMPMQSQSSSPTLIETHLTSSYAEQTSNVYNLTNEGTLDWIQWGLNAPEDVNHKFAVQQQISSFTLIGNGVVQRDNHYANAYTWSDGTPVMVAPPQQPSDVYVRGIGNGFIFTVVASTTPRTLRVYLGAAHAEGHFWAGINGRTITDTTLDMRNNPNIADNGIYTVTFSSNVPDQLLTVKYTVRASDASNGYVMLEAATLED